MKDQERNGERDPAQAAAGNGDRQWLVAESRGDRWAASFVRRGFERQPRLWIAVCVLVLVVGGWFLLRSSGPAVDKTWLTMQERGSWRVGMDPSFPPFETLDGEGAPVGYDVDLAREIAGNVGAGGGDRRDRF